MAYSRTRNGAPSWYQETAEILDKFPKEEYEGLNSNEFDQRLEDTGKFIKEHYDIDIRQDFGRMIKNKPLMADYKKNFLNPVLDAYRNYPTDDKQVKIHLEQVAHELEEAWDQTVETGVVQEAYTTAQYLPLTTMDYPALVKQFIRFLGKDLIPIQTANNTTLEQRIFTKYLVNNQTGEEYEVPRIYFETDEDGTPAWRKIWNAGKGWRFNNHTVLPVATIQAATNKQYNVYNWILDDTGAASTLATVTTLPEFRARVAYDFKIKYVQVTTGSGASAATKKVRLPGNGVEIDIQSGGNFIGAVITENMVLPVVTEWIAPTTEAPNPDNSKFNMPTGETVTGISDKVSGFIDYTKGKLTVSTCGVITGIYIEGHVSNETNTRTIGFREYPEIRKFTISDGCRFQLPFTVEDFAEANKNLNFNLYNRQVQQLVMNSEFFEDQSILDYLDANFKEYDGYASDAFNLESYNHTEFADLDPTAISPTFSGNPFEYRSDAIYNATDSVIYELCDRGKLDNLGFVVYANPKACRLLQKYVAWTTTKGTDIGGVQMNHAFGMIKDSSVPIRVVSSNRVPAYITIEANKVYDDATAGQLTKEYFFKIVAYPMDKHHITFKHLRFARHLTNSPENAAYADAQNPGGAAVMVTVSSQYETISIQGIQGRVICKNTKLVPDTLAGVYTPSNHAQQSGGGQNQGTDTGNGGNNGGGKG